MVALINGTVTVTGPDSIDGLLAAVKQHFQEPGQRIVQINTEVVPIEIEIQ